MSSRAFRLRPIFAAIFNGLFYRPSVRRPTKTPPSLPILHKFRHRTSQPEVTSPDREEMPNLSAWSQNKAERRALSKEAIEEEEEPKPPT
ncbi:MAG: hypothetical protein Q9208_002427 [Pyrenodesmia sp. 3 TL-2023]